MHERGLEQVQGEHRHVDRTPAGDTRVSCRSRPSIIAATSDDEQDLSWDYMQTFFRQRPADGVEPGHPVMDVVRFELGSFDEVEAASCASPT
ncbi:hypothetical protein ACVB8X_41475 [Streptomyces sp. NRAIS4]